MRANDLRLKAPGLWDAVKEGVYDDLRVQKKIHKFEMTKAAAEAISHNAAFMAVSYLHHVLTNVNKPKRHSKLSKSLRATIEDLSPVLSVKPVLKKFDAIKVKKR